MMLIYTLIGLLFAGFVFFLVHKFRKDKSLGRKWYDFGDGNLLVFSIFLLTGAVAGVNLFLTGPQFSSVEEQIEYGESSAQPWLVSAAYAELAKNDPGNLEHHVRLAQAHFDPEQSEGPDYRAYNSEGTFIFYHHEGLAKSKDTAIADIGNLVLGIYYCGTKGYVNALHHLDQVHDTTLKYVNHYRGVASYYEGHLQDAERYFKQEIALNGYLEESYPFLSYLYFYRGDHAPLHTMVNNPAITHYIPSGLRQFVYLRENNFGAYFNDQLARIAEHGNFIGFSGAVLILLTWFIYLMRVNIHRRGGWLMPLLTVLFSAVMVFPVWLLYDLYEHRLDFSLNGEPGNDLLYCIFGIGVIEELIKIVPFLLVLKFTRLIKEPIDYIMYASLSALGFAFVENFLYFREDSMNIIHGRALTASISHMIDSSIIAYGLVLAKFRYKKSQVLFFFAFFLLAAVAHGFYDFWLLNEDASAHWYMTFLLLLVSILVYASFINNALNNPTSLSQNVQLNTARLGGDLAASLIAIFIFEYICLSFIYGAGIGNRELLASTLGGGYMILFLSVRLSNIDIFPGDWSRIEFFTGLLPAHIIYGGKKPNFNSALGVPVRLRVFRKYGKLDDVLPVEGVIVKREKISGFTGWFLVKLSKPMPWLKLNNDYVLIRAKNAGELIGTGEDVIVHFVLIPDLALLEKQGKKIEDFRFMDWAVAGRCD